MAPTVRATYDRTRCATDNPQQFAGYGGYRWGVTVDDGVGAHMIKMSGIVMASPLLDLVAIALMAAARKGGV